MADHGAMASEAANTGTGTDRSREGKIHHTVTACVRCRQRKTRCDANLPRCDGCERSNSHCEYFDSAKNRIMPRKYLVDLQDAVRKLQAELKAIEAEDDDFEPDHESMARAPSLVKFNESNDSRFLGPSSGIAVTRFVMDFARRQANRRTIRDVVSDQAVQETKQTNTADSVKPTSKVYPLISSVAAPNLPNRGLMDQLLEMYNRRAQYMIPLLHEPTFRQDVDAVYNGSSDPILNFQVRLVIAISMQKLDTQYAGLADSYYLAALPFLTDVIARKDIATLQCFAMIAQYSLLTPTRTAAYWVVGLAAKLCQELGICDEKTIDKPPSGVRPNFLEVDMRRRLYWIIMSMEYGLSHSLGRPSAFGVTMDNINVGWFQLCDDRFITPQGLEPGHQPIMKKCLAIHFFKMRMLQAEIRRTLYLRKREAPLTDQDPWFSYMLATIDDWVRDTPKNDEGSGLSQAWFEGRKNTMIIFMHRPSPQIPEPTPEAAERCYRAAAVNIDLQKAQVEHKLIDITWIFTQAIFMALNTVLWSISYPEVRDQHSVDEVHDHIRNGLEAITMCADRWPGVGSAHQLYEDLVSACLRAYDTQNFASPSSKSSAPLNTDGSASASTSQKAQSPISSAAISAQHPQSPQSYQSYPSALSSAQQASQVGSVYTQTTSPLLDPPPSSNNYFPSQSFEQYPSASPPGLGQPASFASAPMNGMPPLQTTNNRQPLPSWDTMTTTAYLPGFPSYSNMPNTHASWLATFGGDFSEYAHSGSSLPYHMQSLNQQEQTDLLQSLEQTRLPEVTAMGGDSTVFYTAGLP